jgi:hypothetical protein
MFKHSVIEILKTLSKKEINNFKKFLTSSYYGRQVVIERLFAELIKYYPEFKSKKLTAENLVSVVSPTGKYSTLRDSLSLLLKSVTDFLAYEQFKPDKKNRNNYSLKSFVERNIQSGYSRLLKQAKSELKNSGSLMDAFYWQFRISQVMYDNTNQNVRRKDITAKKEEVRLLTEGFINFLNYFISSAIRTYYDLSNYSNNFGMNLSSNPVLKAFEDESIFKTADKLKKYNSSYFIIDIYKALLRLNLKSSGRNYQIFKTKILKNESRLAKDEQELLYYELIKYNVVKSLTKTNGLIYEQELLSIYENIVRKGIFIDRNEIPTDLYINILINAFKLKKNKWIEFVTNNYLEKVYKVDRDNAYLLSTGLLLYLKNDFKKSLEYFEKIEPTDQRYNILRRKLIIRNYIKLELYEKALNDIRNLREIINRSDTIPRRNIKRSLEKLKTLEKFILQPQKEFKQNKEKSTLDF